MKRAVAALVASLALAAGAQEAAPRWYVQVDNDFFFDTDRWYSSGVRLARVSPAGPDATEWALQQSVWSPEGNHFRPGVVDRAPTAILDGHFAWHHRDDALFQTIELAAGVRGRGAQGERTTRFVHRFVSAAPVDWVRDVPSEFAASVGATRTQFAGPLAFHYGAVVGNETTFAHVGIEWRTAAAAFSPALRYVATPPFDLRTAAPQGWGAFAGASVRAVARNRLLDRPYEVDTEAPHRKDAVGRVAAGVSAQQAWGTVSLALVLETREFDQQREAQRFGSLMLHLPF